MKSGNTYFEIATITRHLSVMLSSGISINDSLQSIVGQKLSPNIKKVFQGILVDITNGSSLTTAMGKYPKFFGNYYISLVQIGEESGTLEENLKYLSDQLQKDIVTRKKFFSAMLYPSFVLSFAFIVAGGISIFVLPKLVDFFSGFDIPLPLSTKILIGIANYMKSFGIITFAGLAVAIFIVFLISKLGPFKKIWDTLSLKIPFVGNMILTFQITRMSRNLGTLLKSGVSIARSLEVTADSLTNGNISGKLKKILAEIEQGKTLSSSLAHYSEFPALMIKMIEVGEKSGKLDESFLYLANFYDSELDEITKNLETILEPILLVIIGFIVAFIAIAIISPIYQLTGSIGATP